MQADPLILGIDGGGSKTAAWLAAVAANGPPAVLGRGSSGAINLQSVGVATALENLDYAIAAAFREAGIDRHEVAAAVLALAGSAREKNRRVFQAWAEDRRLARRFEIVNDALPVLAATSPEGWGVALISGTGSFAFGRSAAGATARAGGWGFLFGDEGSGYWIALAALRAVAKAADGRAPPTSMTESFMQRLGIQSPPELVAAVYPDAADRAWIASMADLVIEADNQGDRVARQILDTAGAELAGMVAAVARALDIADRPFPLGLAGGVLLGGGLSERLEGQLNQRDLHLSTIQVVREPAAGAVQLAADLTQGSRAERETSSPPP